MMAIQVIIAFMILYYFGLVYLTKKMFERKNIKVSLLMAFLTPIFLTITHIRIAIKLRSEKEKMLASLSDIVFRYPVQVLMFAEIVLFHKRNEKTLSKNVSVSDLNDEKNDYENTFINCIEA